MLFLVSGKEFAARVGCIREPEDLADTSFNFDFDAREWLPFPHVWLERRSMKHTQRIPSRVSFPGQRN